MAVLVIFSTWGSNKRLESIWMFSKSNCIKSGVMSEISFREGRTLLLTFTDGCQAGFQSEPQRLREAKHFLTKPLHWGIQPREQLQKQEPYLQMHRTQSRKELPSNPRMFLGELSTTSNSTTKTEAGTLCLGTLLPRFLRTFRCLCSTMEGTTCQTCSSYWLYQFCVIWTFLENP